MEHKGKQRVFRGLELDRRSGGISSLSDGLSRWFISKGMDPRQTLLGELWKNWDIVMGSFATMAHPLGHRNDILIIGCDDSCIMQELTYAVPEMLERANAFMNADFFRRMEFQLLMDKDAMQGMNITESPVPPFPQKPPRLGCLKLPEHSLLKECYKAYVEVFQDKKT